ncbi:MAG: T9SS type A sorting domain-containing protein [bacterium]
MREIGSIELCIDKPENVVIDMYDISGRKVVSIYEGILEPGRNVLNFYVSDISQGLYLMNFKIGDKNIIKKVVIMK